MSISLSRNPLFLSSLGYDVDLFCFYVDTNIDILDS